MIRTLLRFYLKFNEKFLLLEISTINFQNGFLQNLLILSSIKNPKIIELGAHGHNQGMIGLATHIFLKGKYVLIAYVKFVKIKKNFPFPYITLDQEYFLNNFIKKNEKI